MEEFTSHAPDGQNGNTSVASVLLHEHSTQTCTTHTDNSELIETGTLWPDTSTSDSCISWRSILHQVLAVLAVCLFQFNCGYVVGYTSPTAFDLLKEGVLSDSELVWFGSLATAGAVFGGPVGAVFMSRLSRKHCIMISALPSIIGWSLIAIGTNVWLMYSGRVLVGFAFGFQSVITPVYIAEVSEKKLRGRLNSSNELSLLGGIVTVYSMGLLLTWRWLAIIGTGISVAMGISVCFVPKTPQWCILHSRREEAIESLSWFRGNSDVTKEFHHMEKEVMETPTSKFSLNEFTKKEVYKPLIIASMIFIFQNCNGILPVTFYMGPIFTMAGYSGNANVPPIIIGAVQVVATIIATLFTDKIGRKKLLIASAAVMCIGMVAMGAYFYMATITGIDHSWLLMGSLITYVTGFSIGFGVIPWIIQGEVFPLTAKGVCSGISLTAYWGSGFVVSNFYKNIEDAAGSHTIFWIFAASSFLSIIFVVVFLPETKQKSLEQIRNFFLH